MPGRFVWGVGAVSPHFIWDIIISYDNGVCDYVGSNHFAYWSCINCVESESQILAQITKLDGA
jgi:hypothetical protein